MLSVIFTMPEGRNYPSDPWTDKGLNKTLHVHTMEYPLRFQNEGILTISRDAEDQRPSEVSQL